MIVAARVLVACGEFRFPAERNHQASVQILVITNTFLITRFFFHIVRFWEGKIYVKYSVFPVSLIFVRRRFDIRLSSPRANRFPVKKKRSRVLLSRPRIIDLHQKHTIPALVINLDVTIVTVFTLRRAGDGRRPFDGNGRFQLSVGAGPARESSSTEQNKDRFAIFSPRTAFRPDRTGRKPTSVGYLYRHIQILVVYSMKTTCDLHIKGGTQIVHGEYLRQHLDTRHDLTIWTSRQTEEKSWRDVTHSTILNFWSTNLGITIIYKE